jgi:hypothetical protein
VNKIPGLKHSGKIDGDKKLAKKIMSTPNRVKERHGLKARASNPIV